VLTLAQRLICSPTVEAVPTSHKGTETDKERRPPSDDDPDNVPETPPDEPQPAPVQDPPVEPTTGPYVVSRAATTGLTRE
jgi:hypothetical protein